MTKPDTSKAASAPSITVSGEQAGLTLAALVRELVPGTSWSKARDLCRTGRVAVDGEIAVDSARRMVEGERVQIRTEGGGAEQRGPTVTSLVLHLDADVVVVHKPAGILTVPFERTDRDTLLALTRVAVRRIEAGRGGPQGPTLRAVQRLDKETSGVVVFARTITAQRNLQEQLAARTVTRRYLAIVHGKTEDAVYDTLLVSDRGDGLRGSWGVFRQARTEAPETARQAITRVRVEKGLAGATLVGCELETGRQHQIRIHLAEADHPLLGENVYIRDYQGPVIPAPRPMLHASVLGFVHPRTGKGLRFEDPPPADFNAVLERLQTRRRR